MANNVKKGKLDKSWGAVKPGKIIQKTFKKGPEWVVTFDNPKVENKDKKTLYLFLNLVSGNLFREYHPAVITP